MKIKFVCHKLVVGRGGIETVLVEVANYLSRFFDVSIILVNIPGDKEWLSKLSKDVTVVLPKHENKFYLMLYLLKLSLMADKDEKMIVLGVNLVKAISISKHVLLKRFTLFSWIHFSLTNQDMFDPHNLVWADYHLAISAAIKQQMISMGIPEKKIFLVLNPITRHPLISSRVSESSPKQFHLLYVGRTLFNGQKNLKELFDNVASLGKMATLEIFGSSTENELARCMNYTKQLGISKQVTWHGWTDNPIGQLTNKPFALVMTSTFEGLPMAMLEAISRGIPVITTRFKGYDNVLKEGVNGFSYTLGDIQGFRNAVTQLQQHSLPSKQVSDSIADFYADNYFKRLKAVLERY